MASDHYRPGKCPLRNLSCVSFFRPPSPSSALDAGTIHGAGRVTFQAPPKCLVIFKHNITTPIGLLPADCTLSDVFYRRFLVLNAQNGIRGIQPLSTQGKFRLQPYEHSACTSDSEAPQLGRPVKVIFAYRRSTARHFRRRETNPGFTACLGYHPDDCALKGIEQL